VKFLKESLSFFFPVALCSPLRGSIVAQNDQSAAQPPVQARNRRRNGCSNWQRRSHCNPDALVRRSSQPRLIPTKL